MPTQSEIRLMVTGIVNDDSGKLSDPDDYDRNISAALSMYSKHRPDTKVVDVTGNGTHDYAVSLLTGWTEGFSSVKQVEYPVDEVPESLLENDSHYIYEKPAGKFLRLRSYAPSASETFRVTFTVPRASAGILDNDVGAFCHLAAAMCCEELANAFAQTSDSTIAADAVNYRSKAQEFSSRAKRLMALYKQHMGIKGDDVTPAASVVTDLDVGYPGGGDRITHPRRGRERR